MTADRTADAGSASGKAQLRARLLPARRALSVSARERAGEAIARHLEATPELRAAGVVAGYVGVRDEPPTLPLLTRLLDRGTRVLLPVLREDNDLEWAQFSGPDGLVQAGRGLLEPAGARLGIESVGGVDVVLCPGLAVSRAGLRLGRGGGSYDRVLARTRSAWTCVLLFDGELLDEVPADPHDRHVSAAVTPSTGVVRF